MKINKKKILLLVDHAIDPRLRNRIKLFESNNYDVFVCADKEKGSWVDNENIDIKYFDYSKFKLLKCREYDFLYVSGASVFIKHFVPLLIWNIYKPIICEVPDLPLRSQNKLKTILIRLVFTNLVSFLCTRLVVTSPFFINMFKVKKENIYIRENFPDANIQRKLIQLRKTREHSNDNIVIGIIGAIRYTEQIELLLNSQKYLENSFHIHIYGGPSDRIYSIIEKLGLNNEVGNTIKVLGSFNYESDIDAIYKNITFNYTVYDAAQPNVRYALPNKLYESILTNTPILVAKDTCLANVATPKYGYALPYKLSEQSEFNSLLKCIIEKQFDNIDNIDDIDDIMRLVDDWNSQDENVLKMINNI